MTAEQKKQMFDQVRMDIHFADAWASEINQGSSVTTSGASHLLRLCTKANASAQAFDRVMRGIEPPKLDSTIPSPL